MSDGDDLLANLRELLLLDAGFGVQTLARPAAPAGAPRSPTAPAPAPRPATRPVPATAPVDPDRLPPTSDAHLADLPATGAPDERLAAIATRIAGCQRCSLCGKRSNVVPGEGAAQPELVFIGEGPGADEDRLGRPFVGEAGKLLDKMIGAMGFAREQVFIANIVKCRPPGNREPTPDEMAACLPYLERQVAALAPKVVCSLGNTPLRALTGNLRLGITRQRGKPFSWRGFTVVPTFHPSYLLRNPAAKKEAWEDLKQVLALLGRTPPAR